MLAKNKKIIFKVSGMHCNGCAASISKALGKAKGIEKAEADFAKGTTSVVFNEKLTSKEELSKIIETLGYTVSGEQ